MATPLFALEGVRFHTYLAVDHLEIQPGRVSCIVGASGSGKSTLFRLLNRMISPTEGVVRYRGEDVSTIDAVQLRRRVVMLPQNPVMFEGPIRDNVNAGLRFSGKPPASDEEITRLLAMMRIDKPLDASIGHLSGGERQRVALSRVMVMQPEVLLLDEPTSALDDGTEEIVMRGVIAEVRDRGGEVLLVTHSRSVANAWGEELITIESGSIAEVTTNVHNR